MGIHKTGGLRSFVLLAMLLAMTGALVLFPGGEARADDLQAAVDAWVGAWDTVADGKDKFTFTLQESRLRLNGTYTPGNGQVRGSVSDGVLNLYWSQDGSATGVKLSGRAQLKLSADGKSFTGTSKTDGQDGEHTWSGTLQPGSGTPQPGSGGEKAPSFFGAWQGTLNNLPFTLTLEYARDGVKGTGQSIGVEFGRAVTTHYLIQEGKVTGNKLSFKVVGLNVSVNGIGELTMTEDGKTIYGTFAGMPVGAGRVVTSFAGNWSGAFANNFPLTLTLSQTGDTLTGAGEVIFPGLDPVPTRFTLAEGKVKDNTLSFKVYPLNGNLIQYAGVEQLVLLKDGKTIQGTLGGRPAVAGKVEPVSFTGTWNAVTDDGVAWVFNILNGVPGSKPMGDFYQVNDGATRFTLHFANITGRTLSFDAQLNHKYVGKAGSLVLSADGKSFKGTYGNNTMTGTLK